MRTRHSARLVGLATLLIAAGVQLRPQSANLRHEQPEAAFLLSTSKRAYRAGETIEVTYRIENKGSKAFYVNPEMSQLHGFDVGVVLSLYDSSGRRVPYQVTGYGPVPDYSSMNIVDHVRRNWLLLRPGTFYGTGGRYHTARPPGKGRYKLLATYTNNLFHVLTPGQMESLKELEYQVLAGTHRSNEVWIDIVD